MCSKYDFVCLGLRPHLMLKLVSKPPPESDGPHGFKDLFSTVVIERPDAFPWLPKGRGMYEPDADNINQDDGNDPADDFNEDGDLMGDDGAMPSHLDADPQELFLRPGDDVVNALGADAVDVGGLSYGFAGGDLDLCERPQTVDNVDIGYSRNSKYVNVKLVKKHLWDCISGEEAEPKKAEKKKKSIEPVKPSQQPQTFQQLISGTMNRLPESETPNLSVAVCFVCQLHLCNEKNLELEVTDPLRSFQVRMPS
jgi:condensin complex subunit 2